MNMLRLAANTVSTIKLVARTALVSAVLVAPVLAVPAIGGDHSLRLEAPALKKKGAGLVILVSLQRG